MTSRAAAGRYARALFDVALAERADLTVVERQLIDASNLVTGNETLHRVLTNPAVPAPKKRVVMQELVARAGTLLGPVAKLLVMLAERDRLSLLPDLVDAFRSRLLDHLNVVRAEVVTAVPLSPERVSALQANLARATGREVRLDATVDESIVGGAVARLGGTVYDGSVTRQLAKLKEALAGAGD